MSTNNEPESEEILTESEESSEESSDEVDESQEDQYAHLNLASKALMRFPPDAVEEILQMMAEGKGCRPVAAMLKDHYGIVLSPKTVNKLLMRERSARVPIATALVRERMAGSVDNYAKIVEHGVDELREYAAKLLTTKKDYALYLKFRAELREYMKLGMHMQGLGPAESAAEAQAIAATGLAEKLAGLATKLAGEKPKADEPVIDVEVIDDGSTG